LGSCTILYDSSDAPPGRHPFSWDYDLTADKDMLLRGRVGGQLPFESQPSVWRLLNARKRQLSLEQDYHAQL